MPFIMSSMGTLFGLTAFSIYGFVPVYYNQLTAVPVIQIGLHRFAWTFVSSVSMILVLRQHKAFVAQAWTFSNVILYGTSAACLGSSTLLTVWAIHAGYILEVSLGAFLNPITFCLLGMVFLNERLRRWQLVSVALTLMGVGIFTVAYGRFPWVAVLLSLCDGVYGLVKKRAPLTPLHGLAMESGILFPFCIAGLIVLEAQKRGAFAHIDVTTDVLLAGTGVLTIVPLLLFIVAIQTAHLSGIGIISNVSPTIQFLLGVFVYHESCSMTKLIGFVFLWISMIIFIADSFTASKQFVEKANDDDERSTIDVLFELESPTTPVMEEVRSPTGTLLHKNDYQFAFLLL
ncbi:Aste57867_8962 [Aphanomyces stellatus]|uniref:Aste57867_8962 protein n=1 Tax=Aphanomyces stellatus TaxID=120398 RepID=A0A485KLQ3_9STRA|nr:hypothetical protein As57867_008927 [Aphanomyces stellatus]VFT85846.1 Aste57867_8962 [Aphanomyces stellatus]